MKVLKIWQTAGLVFLGLVFWIVVLALPESADPLPSWVRLVLAAIGFVVLLVGVLRFVRGWSASGEGRAETVFLGFVLAVIGVVLFVVAGFSGSGLALTPGQRFAIGVGGAALCGFIYAATQFDTLRAAASVPVVYLLVGVVVWPDADKLIEPEVRTALITWMGVIISANGVAEAAKQVGESVARSRGEGTKDVRAGGDLTTKQDARESGPQ